MFKSYFIVLKIEMDLIRNKHLKIIRKKYIKDFTAFWYRSLFVIHQYFYGVFLRITREKNKSMVFCLGFSKTGTSSLNKAFSILGYRNVHWLRASLKPKQGWIEYIKKSPFDAFSDSPMYYPNLFKEIDKAFPDSKFILTAREPESLVRSWKNYFVISPWSIDNDEDKITIIKMYNDHKKNVIEYFKDRPNDLLIIDIIGGDGWNKLCKFLNKPIPKMPFPHKRISQYRSK